MKATKYIGIKTKIIPKTIKKICILLKNLGSGFNFFLFINSNIKNKKMINKTEK